MSNLVSRTGAVSHSIAFTAELKTEQMLVHLILNAYRPACLISNCRQ